MGGTRGLTVQCALLFCAIGASAASAPAELLLAQNGRQEDTPVAARYRALVDQYRNGPAPRAVGELVELEEDAVGQLVRRLVELAGPPRRPALDLDDAFFGAASVLHLDGAIHSWKDGRAGSARFHLHASRRLVDVFDSLNPKATTFRSRWYLAAALSVFNHTDAHQAAKQFEAAVEAVPGDVALLTAAGWLSERMARSPAAPNAAIGRAEAIRRQHQRAAVRFLTAALEVDPRAIEAALRLARVELVIGREERARDRLTELVTRDDLEPAAAYLARLFLGDLYDRQGAAQKADRWYREAIALQSNPQSARLALAKLVYASGDAAATAAAVEPLLDPPTAPDEKDPWWDYQVAYAVLGPVLIDALREEVQR